MSTQEILKQRFLSSFSNLTYVITEFDNEVLMFNPLSGDTLLLDAISFSLLVHICNPILETVDSNGSSVVLDGYELEDLTGYLNQLEELGFIRSLAA